MKLLIELFTVFFKLGAFTFGGGYAMLPLIEKEIVENKKWAAENEILDYFAIGQCTPGVIAVNTATFIGCKLKGAVGGIVATIGVVLPSFIIISVIASFLKNFADYEIVRHIFGGIRVVVAVLIVNAVVSMVKKAVVDKICLVIFLAALIYSLFFSFSPVWIVLLGGLSGLLIKKGGAK